MFPIGVKIIKPNKDGNVRWWLGWVYCFYSPHWPVRISDNKWEFSTTSGVKKKSGHEGEVSAVGGTFCEGSCKWYTHSSEASF